MGQWKSSPDEADATWSAIDDAESATYTPVAANAGKLLRVSYDDAVGMGRSAVSAVTKAVDQRGGVTLSPQTPVVDEAVTATLTDADGDVTNEAWQWERSPETGTPEWSVISGAQTASYTPTTLEDAGKVLRVVVTYTDGTGTGRGATSAATNRVDQRGTITLSTGVPDVGIEVTASLSDDDGGVTGEMWQWQSSPSSGTPPWTDITGATTGAYTPVAADEGALLRAMVGYEDAVGSDRSSTSQATQRVGKPGTVSLDSTEPVVGEQLRASLTDADGSVSNQVWQWDSSPAQEVPTWSSITGVTSASYTPQAGDAGHLLRVRITYSDGSGTGREANSTATERVDSPGMVTLSPDPPVVGKPVRATVTDADGSVVNQTWEWERSPGVGDIEWTAIGGDQSDSYTPTSEEDAGKLLRVIVSYDDTIGIGRSATSSATERVDREGVVTVNPSPPVAGRPVTATLSDADGMVSNQVWKWERSPRMGTPAWTLIADATASNYAPIASADGGMLLKATVSYDDKVGSGRVAVSASTLPVDQPGVVTLTTTEPVTGEALTATLIDGDGGILNSAWQWESSPNQETTSWSAITGAEASMYTAPASLAGKLLRAVVNYDDTTGRGRRAMSDTTAPLDQLGIVTLSPDAPIVGQAVTATLTDADGGLTNQTWVWESSLGVGLPSWESLSASAGYTPIATDAGKRLRVVVAYTDGSGSGRMATALADMRVDQRGMVSVKSMNTTVDMPEVGVWQDSELIEPDGMVDNEMWQWEMSPYGTESERVWMPVPGGEVQ